MTEKRIGAVLLSMALLLSAAVAGIVGFRDFYQSESIFSAICWSGFSFFLAWNSLRLVGIVWAVATKGFGAVVKEDLPDEEEADRIRKSAAVMLKERRKTERRGDLEN